MLVPVIPIVRKRLAQGPRITGTTPQCGPLYVGAQEYRHGVGYSDKRRDTAATGKAYATSSNERARSHFWQRPNYDSRWSFACGVGRIMHERYRSRRDSPRGDKQSMGSLPLTVVTRARLVMENSIREERSKPEPHRGARPRAKSAKQRAV